MPGMTLSQYASVKFFTALDEYRQALRTKDSHKIVAASLKVYGARRNDGDRTHINRVFKEA